jgi:hypothetical protein
MAVLGRQIALESSLVLRGEPLDDRASGILRVCIAASDQSSELIAQMTKLSDASVDKSQLVDGKLSGGRGGSGTSRSR